MVPPIKYVYTLAFLSALAYGAPLNEASSPLKRGDLDLSVRSPSISIVSAPSATVAVEGATVTGPPGGCVSVTVDVPV